MVRSPENQAGQGSSPEIESKIKRITFVVPSLNESRKTTSDLVGTIYNQEIKKPTLLSLVISDNGSDKKETLDVNDEIKQKKLPEQQKIDIFIVERSLRGFVGSARREGVKEARTLYEKNHPRAPSKEHLIANFDADTKFKRNDALEILKEIFEKDPETMLVYGPIEFESSTGKVSSEYRRLQRPFTRILLSHLFRSNDKRMDDYINRPYQIFHGIFFVMRADLFEKGINYDPEDIVGDDVRISLESQRRLKKGQVIFDPRLSVRTSARGYETEKGEISRFKFIKKAWGLFFGTEYAPYTLQEEVINRLPEEEKPKITKSLRFADVVGSFARKVDEEVYRLGEGEHLISQGVNKIRAEWLKRKKEYRIVPAKSLKNTKDLRIGGPIPNRYSVIGPKKPEGK
jgi:hypothetical protein